MTRPDATLAGVTVLVTRPAGQGENLCRAVEAAGGTAVHVPVITIQPLEGEQLERELRQAVSCSGGILFVSRSAVAGALALLGRDAAVFAGKQVYAAGAGTRRALQEQGIDARAGADATRASEALLELPELAAANVAGRDFALLRGEGGRELLAEELQRRGARVHVVELYRRARPEVTPQQMHALWRDTRPDVVVITSATGLYNLAAMTAAEDMPVLLRAGLVVMSERIAAAAAGLGFECKPVIAAVASDAGLLEAVMACTEWKRQ